MKEKYIDLVDPELKPLPAEMKTSDLSDETLAESRRMFEQLMSPPAPPTSDVSVSERKISAQDENCEINVFIYTPKDQKEPLSARAFRLVRANRKLLTK